MSVDILGKWQLERFIPPWIDIGRMILWIDGKGSEFRCRVCKTAYTPTAITYDTPALNLHQAINAKFNGTTSKVDCTAQALGSGDLSIAAWINATDFGGNSVGRICDNGKAIFRINTTNSTLQFSSDGATYASAANSSISTGTWQMVGVTRTKTNGTANLYVNGALSGTANQSSGTPANGTTNLFIGNDTAGTEGFKGYIGLFIVFNVILSASDMGMIYNNTK